MTVATIPLHGEQFTATEQVLLATDGLVASGFRYPTGVAALRLANARGHVMVLPWLGQIVWDAMFDGVRLTMRGLFDAPRPAAGILDTYGCFAFHSGLLRNGCPGPEDSHALHGEFACAAMDSASLVLTQHDDGVALRLDSVRDYAQGFGNRYHAVASVALGAGQTLFDIGLAVQNTGGRLMDLMYLCHVNFDFVAGGRIIQPAPFTPETMAVRSAIPAHVASSARHRTLIAALAADPSIAETLDPATGYDPEQVFYLNGLGRDPHGLTHLLLRRPAGDGFALSYDPAQFPHLVRWLLLTEDHAVAAFALPSTCHPEGYTAERRKGHVASLAAGATRTFAVRTGYVDAAAATRLADEIPLLVRTDP